MLFSKFLGLLSTLSSICKSFLEVKKEKKEYLLVVIIVAVAFCVVIVEQFASKSENEKSVNNTIYVNHSTNLDDSFNTDHSIDIDDSFNTDYSIDIDDSFNTNNSISANNIIIKHVTIIQNIEKYYASNYGSGMNTSGNDGNSNSESMPKKGNADETAAATGTSNLKRNTYSLQQANEGAMIEAVTFNSYKITDADEVWYKELTGKEIPKGTMRNETNFVGARVNNGINAGKDNRWEGTEIVAEDGQTYFVRLYIHNNGDDVAEDTKIRFYVPYGSSDTMIVDGWLTSSNAVPNQYLDDVTFKSKDGSPFRLEYVEGSALLENGGMAKDAGKVLPDNICNQGNPTNAAPNEWITIGYDAFDGKIPGGYEYINYATIQVKAVYD